MAPAYVVFGVICAFASTMASGGGFIPEPVARVIFAVLAAAFILAARSHTCADDGASPIVAATSMSASVVPVLLAVRLGGRPLRTVFAVPFVLLAAACMVANASLAWQLPIE